MRTSTSRFLSILWAAAVAVSTASAAELDCTSGCDKVLRFNATWSTGEVQPSGTGVLDPFVQLQNNPTEFAYNTTANNTLDNKSSDQHNHELLLSLVPIKEILGIDYREFLLDLGEPQEDQDRYISLDGLQLYLSNTPNQSTSNISSLGALVYDLDSGANNAVLLDSGLIGSGNGKADLFVYIPDSLFSAQLANVSLTDPFVYLWSAFGLTGQVNGRNYGTAGTFEEWAVQTGSGTEVPEPATYFMLLSAGALLVVMKRRQVRV